MDRTDLAIIGAGHAGVELASGLRQRGFDGSIALISEETALPYDRPPLSKGLLAGKVSPERIALRATSFFEKQDIRLMTGCRVQALDAGRSTIAFEDGETLAFGRCVLAIGAGARRLSLPGYDLEGVFYLRGIADSLALRAALTPFSRLVVVGGGYLGLEAASTARALGAQVTVLENAGRLMPGRVSVPVAEAFAALHEEMGTEIRLGSGARAFLGTRHVEAVQTTKGEELPADLVLVAVGATPNASLASEAGIECDDGILVDAEQRSSSENVFAIGDCARPALPCGERPRRVESVHSALSQARVLAARLLDAQAPAVRPPYFWTEQCGVKLQVTGSLRSGLPIEDVLIGALPEDFAVYRMQEGRLACVEAVGQPAAFVRGQRLIGKATLADLQLTA